MKNESGGHKWLECMIGGGKLEGQLGTSPTACKLLPRPSLLPEGACERPAEVFDAVVSPDVLFGCGHRSLHQKDVACRKFLRAMVGPPSNLDWTPVA